VAIEERLRGAGLYFANLTDILGSLLLRSCFCLLGASFLLFRLIRICSSALRSIALLTSLFWNVP
jgi:hypothetical protein